jgi:O-antigen/teichoic acid export membrane protein
VLRLLKTSLAAAVVLMGAAAAIVAAVSPFIMRLYGAEFRSGWPVLCVLLAVAVVYSANMLIFSCLFATGRFWSVLLLNLAWAAIYLGVTHLLRQDGALAIAVAQLAALVAMDLMALAVLRKTLGSDRPALGA